MGKLEDAVWEEGGWRTEQQFVIGSFSFHSQVFLPNVATSVCSDLPATGIDGCLPKKEGGREVYELYLCPCQSGDSCCSAERCWSSAKSTNRNKLCIALSVSLGISWVR